MKNKIQVDISAWTITKIILILITFYLVFVIRDIITLFVIVLILAAALNPLVDRWEKYIKRGPAVALIFALVMLAIAAIIYLIVPPLVEQAIQLINQLPQLMIRFGELQSYTPTISRYLTTILDSLTNISGSIFSITANIFGSVFAFVTVIVLTAYLLIDKEAFSNFFLANIPSERRRGIADVVNKIGQKVGSWVQGELILGLIIGTLDLIGLLIIGVPYALVLAVIAGILEIVPTIGPIIAGILATGVALTVSPVKAIFVAILFFLIQQVENNFIVPKVMQKAVGLSPVIIIFAILVGAKLLGVLGGILAVPIAASLSVVIQEWPTISRAIDKDAE